MPKFYIDWQLTIPVIFLLLLGLLIIRSVAPDLFFVQLGFIVVSVLVFLLFSTIEFSIVKSLHFPVFLCSLAVLGALFLWGAVNRGAARWLTLGGYTLQPSEIIKPFLLITFSVIALSNLRHKLLILVVVGAVPIYLVFRQPDLGTALVIAVGWAAALLSRLRLRTILLGMLVVAVLTIPAYYFALKDYQRQRLVTYIDPYRDPLNQGYHVIQSLISVGSGQLFGRGLGHGTQSQLRFLPEHHTDFIFSALSEELGFVGSLATIVLFIVFLRRIYVISQNNPDPVASLFCLTATCLFTFQIFINIGMNMGIAPITGITLPFLSYGGSSLLSYGIFLGIISSISRFSD